MTEIVAISRPTDGTGFYLHFTGGFRAAKIADDIWRVEPAFINNFPHVTGPLTMAQLQTLAMESNFIAVAFHRFGWTDGEYFSSWTPIIPGRTNHSEGPAEIWNNIAKNIASERTKEFLKAVQNPNREDIAAVLDDQTPVEALARYISLSLRSMDTSMEQIAEHYHEQLVNHMAAGRIAGERSANTLSQTLYAHVHSFFLHLGAARDYLGALIAHRIGLDSGRTDSMARLVGELRQSTIPEDSLLNTLLSYGYISAHAQKQDRLTISGWMQEVTSLRNELVHKRPYGSKFSERWGWVCPSKKEAGLFRYFRPLEINGSAEQDVLDVLHYHYAHCTNLMYKAANATGNNAAMIHITDDDIISS